MRLSIAHPIPFACVACTIAVLLMTPAIASADTAVALYRGNAIEIAERLADPTDLWVTPADLTRMNGFELKPEGLCLEDICIPVRTNDADPLAVERDGQTWVNTSALARRMNQAVVADVDAGIWSFAPMPTTITGGATSVKAPDFTLPNTKGELISLSDFRGKKVLLLTWASW